MLKDQARRTKAIKSEQDCFISAGAGTGKSTLIAEKISHLLERNGGCGITEFAAITFTRLAAEDLKNKIKKSICRKLNEKITSKIRLKLQDFLDQFEQCRIGTIHSFCASWLREYSIQLEIDPQFEILEPSSYFEELIQFLGHYLENLYQNREDPKTTHVFKVWDHLQKYEKIPFEKLASKIIWLCDRIDVLSRVDEKSFLIKNESRLNDLKKAVFKEHKERFSAFAEYYSSREDKLGKRLQETIKHVQKYDHWEECIRRSSLDTVARGSEKNVSYHQELTPKQILSILKYYLKVFSGKKIEFKELSSELKEKVKSWVVPRENYLFS